MRGVKSREVNKFRRIAIFFVLLIIFIVLVNSVFRVYKKKKGAEEVLIKMQEEMILLEQREKNLGASLARLETDEGLEFELRKKLNVASEGESVAIIVTEEVEDKDVVPEKSSFQKIKERFKQLFKGND
jgi:hypothetical protein